MRHVNSRSCHHNSPGEALHIGASSVVLQPTDISEITHKHTHTHTHTHRIRINILNTNDNHMTMGVVIKVGVVYMCSPIPLFKILWMLSSVSTTYMCIARRLPACPTLVNCMRQNWTHPSPVLTSEVDSWVTETHRVLVTTLS